MSKNKPKEKTEKEVVKKSVTESKKKQGSFVNIILVIVLIAGIGWLIYNNTSSNKQSDKLLTKDTQVKEFINKHSEILFSKADLKIKNIEKEDGLWRSILEIDGQLQDFYITTDSQIVQETETFKKLLKSNKKENIGEAGEDGLIKIDDNLKIKIKEFINENLVAEKTTVEVKEVVVEHGLIKAVTTYQEKEQPLYITLNGKRLVFGIISIEEFKDMLKKQEENQKKASTVNEDNKNDKPIVEYFVMSHCPFGVELEKGLTTVLRVLGDKIDPKLKFVSFAMHDKIELEENLVQYCIQKDQSEKLYDYLDCFAKDFARDTKKNIEYAKKCLVSVNVDDTKLQTCISATDKEFNILSNYEDKSTWTGRYPTFNTDKEVNEKYNINGSPSFVVNRQVLSVDRDSQSILEAICSGFKNPPVECSKTLSSESNGANGSCK